MSSVKPEQDPLQSFALLPKDVEKRLRGLLHVHQVQAGEAIFFQGEPPDAIYLIASGRVKIVRSTPEGCENILCLRGSGEYFCPVPVLDRVWHNGCHPVCDQPPGILPALLGQPGLAVVC
jgi:hypothetical protein